MIKINPNEQLPKALYKLLIGSVIPRPIAFVSTLNKTNTLNAAPFSYYNIVSSNPPMIMISVGKRDGKLKDTAENILRNESFVVHATTEGILEKVNQTSANLAANISEVDWVNLTKIESEKITTPGIKEALVRFECTLYQHVALPNSDMFIGKIEMMHFADSIYENGKINPDQLKPVARLAGNDYTTLGTIKTLERPE
mgnify:CR=1 FL=1